MQLMAIIGIWSEEWEEPAYFLLRAMPFGARGAVFIFGHTARSISHLQMKRAVPPPN